MQTSTTALSAPAASASAVRVARSRPTLASASPYSLGGAALPCRRPRGPRPAAAVPTEFATGPDTLSLASNVVSTLLAGACAYVWAKQQEAEEDDDECYEPCANCGGSGYEECHCTRWSDGDVGCQSCNYTGMSRCKVCGGGGRAIRVPVRLEVRTDDHPDNFR